MNLLGSVDVPELTNDGMKYGGFMGQPTQTVGEGTGKGEWTWHKQKILWDDFQMQFNADNSVFYVVNFSHKSVKDSKDPTKNIAFYLVDTDERVQDEQYDVGDTSKELQLRTSVCDKLAPVTSEIDKNLIALGEYFEQDDSAFYSYIVRLAVCVPCAHIACP